MLLCSLVSFPCNYNSKLLNVFYTSCLKYISVPDSSQIGKDNVKEILTLVYLCSTDYKIDHKKAGTKHKSKSKIFGLRSLRLPPMVVLASIECGRLSKLKMRAVVLIIDIYQSSILGHRQKIKSLLSNPSQSQRRHHNKKNNKNKKNNPTKKSSHSVYSGG